MTRGKRDTLSKMSIIANSSDFIENSNDEILKKSESDIKKQIIEYIDKNSYNTLNGEKFNIEWFKTKLIKKMNKIPKDNFKNPRISIIGPIIENLKYYFDEEHICDMYINLIIREIDNNICKEAMLFFPNIINQLSLYDKNLIKNLDFISKERNTDRMSICFIKERATNDPNHPKSSLELGVLLVDNTGKDDTAIVKPDAISLDNLIRLRIIEINKENYLVKDEDKIRETFTYYRDDYEPGIPELELFCEPGILEITKLGRMFIDLCVLDKE